MSNLNSGGGRIADRLANPIGFASKLSIRVPGGVGFVEARAIRCKRRKRAKEVDFTSYVRREDRHM